MPTPTNLPELPPGPDLENLRGSIDATTSTPWPIVLAVLILLTIAVGLLLRWWIARRKRNNEQKTASPFDLAEQALQRARKIDPDDAFAAQTSLAVRTSMGAIISKPMTITTAELKSELKDNPNVNTGQIHQLLQSCDCVKFSGSSLTQEERIQIFDSAEQIIADLRQATATNEKKTAQT